MLPTLLQQPDREGGQFRVLARMPRHLPSLTVGLPQLQVTGRRTLEELRTKSTPGA